MRLYGYHPWGDYDGSSGDPGTGDTTGLVYFTDPSNNDFTLAQSSSAAISSGFDLSGLL